MGRTRNPAIAEDAAELRRQARRNAGKPQQRRLLFLAFLKENPTCSIAEGAEAAGLSARQGRYLWEDYRAGGLERVLARRSWKSRKPEALPDVVASSPEGTVAGMTATDLLNFMNAVARLRDIRDTAVWARHFGNLFIKFLPEVDYAVVSLITTVDVHFTPSTINRLNFIYTCHQLPDGTSHFSSLSSLREYESNYQRLVQQGAEIGFPFDQYHFPPHGFDFFRSDYYRNEDVEYEKMMTDCIGSLLLFRNKANPPFSSAVGDWVNALRPFFNYVFTDYIARIWYAKPEHALFLDTIGRVSGSIGFTLREQEILRLLLLGNTYEEIAELLTIAPATVGKHVRSIYKKAGVRRLSEFFARYFTPRDYFPEKEKKGE